MSPEVVVEMHLQSVKKINKDKKVYQKKLIDKSFIFLIKGIMAFDIAYKKYIDSKINSYLAEIEDLNTKLSKKFSEMTALYETVKITGSFLDIEDVLSSVFNNIVKTLKAEIGYLMLFDPGEEVLTIKRAHGLTKEVIKRTRIKMGESIAEMVAQSGEPMIIRRGTDALQNKGRKRYGYINCICALLKTKKRLIGIINLNRKRDSEPFTEDDLNLLSTMAHEAATAIENVSLYRDLSEGYLSIVHSMISALEVKDPYIKGHSDAVARYAVAIAKRLNISPQGIETIEMAALLHDIGKIGIHEDILNKPGKLDEEDWKEMKKHPEIGLKILNGVNFPWDIRPVIYHHHERYDGKGYPAGIKGKEIPLGARIIAVADSYDSITSERAYRKGLSKKVAIKELERVAGAQLDPEIVGVFVEMLK